MHLNSTPRNDDEERRTWESLRLKLRLTRGLVADSVASGWAGLPKSQT